MIVKMKFLSITGPKADIDRVVNTYLSKYEIHLENALTELSTMQNITPYIQINPYKETLKQAEDFTPEAGISIHSGTRPSASPSIGQPSSQRQGINVGTRPMPPLS